MATSSSIRAASHDAQAQIRELRGQMDQLMRQRVSPAVSDVASRAGDYARDARDLAREQTGVLSAQVQEMPIASVLIAAAVGYLVGRLTR